MPFPRKPTQLKAISGSKMTANDFAPSIEVEALSEVPAPVDWLPNAHAVKEWIRLAPLLVANRLLTEMSLQTFGHFCAVHGKIVQLYAAGEGPTGHMQAQYNALGAAFGLAPAWLSKVKSGDGKKPQNKFGQLKVTAK